MCGGWGGQRHDIFTNTDFIDIVTGLRSISKPDRFHIHIMIFVILQGTPHYV